MINITMNNYTKRKLATCGLCAILSMPAYADESVLPVDSLTLETREAPISAVPWDIIGMYAATPVRTEKFYQPAAECELVAPQNTLIQLELCKSIRKGWLKI